jgi:ethanolamine transporter EutH
MKNIDSTYVAIGASWLLVGMILGIIMGATIIFNSCLFTLTSI